MKIQSTEKIQRAGILGLALALLVPVSFSFAAEKTNTPIYEMNFAKVKISIEDWTTVPLPKEASWSLNPEGKPVVIVKALPALTADACTSVYFDKVPKLTLDKPAIAEWGFRYKGVGLKAVTLTLKSSYNAENKRKYAAKTLQVVPVANNATSDWQRGTMKIVEGTTELNDISFWDLSLLFAPGADFTIEIDSIKILAADQP